MNWSDISILYWRELKSALRERSIVINSILIPILLYPLMFWLMYTAFTFVTGQTDGMDSRIVFVNFPTEHNGLRKEFVADRSFKVVESNDADGELRDGSIDAIVEFLPGATQAVRAQIHFDESRDESVQAKTRAEDAIMRYRLDYLQDAGRRLGVSREQFQNFWIESENVSTDRQMGQFLLGLLLPVTLMVMLTLGGFYPAVDATAGERENSTWETIMTASTSRTNVVMAKYFYVATMSFTAALLNVMVMTFSMGGIIAQLGPQIGPITFRIPLASMPIILAGTALMSLFVAAGMMILASFARNFKEGQSMASAFYIMIIVPVMFLQTPGTEFTLKLALIPVVNVTIMFREAIMGAYNWTLIAITLAVELVCIVACVKVAVAILSHEDIVTGTYRGSFAKFFRERLLGRTAPVKELR